MEENTIVLIDENGDEHEFSIEDVVEIDDVQYAVLLPYEDPEEGVVVLRIEKDDNGEDVLVSIDDEEEFEKVREILENLDDEE